MGGNSYRGISANDRIRQAGTTAGGCSRVAPLRDRGGRHALDRRAGEAVAAGSAGRGRGRHSRNRPQELGRAGDPRWSPPLLPRHAARATDRRCAGRTADRWLVVRIHRGRLERPAHDRHARRVPDPHVRHLREGDRAGDTAGLGRTCRSQGSASSQTTGARTQPAGVHVGRGVSIVAGGVVLAKASQVAAVEVEISPPRVNVRELDSRCWDSSPGPRGTAGRHWGSRLADAWPRRGGRSPKAPP